MRIAVGLLACIGAGALTTTLADQPTEAAAAATTAPAQAPPAASTPAAATSQAAPAATTSTAATAASAAAKAQLDGDTRHFLALGYKPEMHHGEQVYCRKETNLGSRLTQVKNCGTIQDLKLQEDSSRTGVADAQRKQAGTTTH
ncbi:MAG TPA: hypothetical protein VFI86_08795 [Burkholderiales bacterium]|nr:hypothetical protein [Burkholderiales bacterium]